MAMLPLLLLISIASTVRAANFLTGHPPHITPCQLQQSDNGYCVTDVFQNVFTHLHDGIPGYRRIPKLDPLKIKRVHVKVTTIAKADLEMKNTLCTGLANATVDHGSFTNGNNFKFSVKVPKFIIRGDYKLKAEVSVINIDGKGDYNLNITDLKFIVNMKTKTVDHSGVHFIQPISLRTKMINIGDIDIQFDDLYPGDLEGTEATNEILNLYKDRALIAFMPVVQKALDATLLRYFKKLFGAVPAQYIFEDYA